MQPHRIMTPDEYDKNKPKGWHEVFWDVDGAGGVGVRYTSHTVLEKKSMYEIGTDGGTGWKYPCRKCKHHDIDGDEYPCVICVESS